MARILFVGNDARTFLSHRLPIARAAIARGHDVAVALPRGDRVRDVEDAGIRVVGYDLDRRGTRPWKEFATYRELRAAIAAERPDLLHLVTIKPIVYGGRAANVLRVPSLVCSVTGLGFVFSSDRPLARALRPVVARAYHHAFAHQNARVLFQNEDDRAELVRRGLVSADRASCIPGGSGIDPVEFRPTTERDGPCTVVLPARMLRDKGILEFAQAARDLLRAGADARFALVGDVDPGNPESLERREIEAIVEESGVEWWGWRDDMPVVLSEANVVCLPSYREGVPRVLLEAAASARAIVTTDVPGCRDAVEPERSGILIRARDANALKLALDRLIRDRTLRERMGARGRELALERFTQAAVATATMDVYDALIRAAAAARPGNP